MINLEPLAAAAAARMVGADPGDALNIINKALMVLAEQGLFAFGLFLSSRPRERDQRAAGDLHQAVVDLLMAASLAEPPPAGTPRADYYRALTNARNGESSAQAVQRIVLTKQFVEVALTYGRYQAKARNPGG